MKIRIALLTIISALAVAHADPTPPPATPLYTAAIAALNALPPTAAPQDYVTAQQAIVNASDEPAANRGADLTKLAWYQLGAGYAPETYLATYLDAWQSGGYRQAFQNYLQESQKLGGNYVTTANAHIADYVAASPNDHFSYAALAIQAETAGNWQLAFTQWKAVADKFTAYDSWVSWGVEGMIRASAQLGDSPATVNAYIIKYLTARTVHVADNNYIACYDAVDRSPANLSLADLKKFLIAVLTVVDVTPQNAVFLGRVQSQLAALPQ